MILKELRISNHLSQEQLAQMSGLNVRTIQRIESGHNASLESLKCLASALEVDVSTLNQEKYTMDKKSDNWKALPFILKCWFVFNFLQARPTRQSARRIEVIGHVSGFIFCCLGLVNEAALVGGLIMLSTAYLYHWLKYQGDKYGIWYEHESVNNS
ncbi:helix-turn-helix domain-containing protein [Thalassotalea maritima]|uniref:helix-turn-helix domain-containing protein n=1 Tax=Thalassotalea maritima TaxID=3242416 RepID=UPI0035292E89